MENNREDQKKMKQEKMANEVKWKKDDKKRSRIMKRRS